MNVSNLVSIDISNSELWGRVPLDLCELPNLQYLDLSSNKNLEGSCAQLLKGSWRRIEVLILASNNLHGKFPLLPTKFFINSSFWYQMNNVEGTIKRNLFIYIN